jgi:hypothetical protein
MSAIYFIAASLTPLIALVLIVVGFRRRRASSRAMGVVLGLLLSAPLGVFFVTLSLRLNLASGVEHSPGTGVAFLPLVLVWLSTCIAVAVYRLVAATRHR